MRVVCIAAALAVLSVTRAFAASSPAPVFNVTDSTYGAVPNDSGNDDVAINNAINDAEDHGGVVYFPPGTYDISVPLTINGPFVTLRGEGATLKAASESVDVIVVTGTNDIVIEDLTILGMDPVNLGLYPGTGTAIDVRQSSFVRIRNNKIRNMSGTGIIVTGKTSTSYSDDQMHDAWVQNNFLEYCNQGITIFSGAKHIFVRENTIQYARTWSIGVDDRSTNDTEAHMCESVEIVNNVVRFSGMTSASQTAIAIVGSRYCTVTGNQVIDAGQGVSPTCPATAIGISSGQSDYVSANNLVANNLIVRPVRGGIHLAAADYNSIQGNTLVDVGTNGPPAATSAIKLVKAALASGDHGSSYNRISDNVVIRTGSADTDYGVRIDDSLCTANSILNETHRGVTAAALSDAGTGTVSWRVLSDGTDVAAKRDMATSLALTFSALLPSACETLTATLSGAADGDLLTLGIPHALANDSAQTFTAWASGTNSVRIRRCNASTTTTLGSVSGSIKIGILKR